MLMNSGIKVPDSVYNEISQYNHGVGDASQMIRDYQEKQLIKSRPLNLDWSGTPGDFGIGFGF